MSKHHRAVKWTGKTATHRARLRMTLPAQCIHCGGLVDDSMPWDVAHVVDLALGGRADHVGVAHRHCNRSDGGRRGNAKRHGTDWRSVEPW